MSAHHPWLLAAMCLLALSPVSEGQPATSNAKPRTERSVDKLPPGAIARIGGLGLRHAAEVETLAFSPDGKLLASSSMDATLRIWDVAAAREVHRIALDGKLERAGQRLAFSPDGKLLTFASQEQVISFWSTDDWKQQYSLQGASPNGVSPVFAFAPDSKTFVWWSNDDTIRLRDLTVVKNLREWPGRRGHVPRFAFSPDSKRLAVANSLTTTVFDIGTGKEICQFQEEVYAPYSLAFAPNGKTLAVGSRDCVRLCDSATGKEKRRLTGHAMPVQWMQFTPDGAALLASGADGTCRLWNVATGKQMRQLVLEQVVKEANPIRLMAFAPDGKTLARVAGKEPQRIMLTDVATGRDLQPSGGDPHPYHFAFTADSKALVAPCSDGMARLWDIATVKELRRFLEAEDKPYHFVLSADGKILVALGKQLTVWDATSGKLRHRGAAPRLKNPYPDACALSPDGMLLAVGEVDRARPRPGSSIFWWDLDKDKEQSHSPATDGRRIESLAFTPDGKVTASADVDGWVYLWDAATGKELGRAIGLQPIVAVQLAFAPDGKALLMAQSHFVQGQTGVRITRHDPATCKELPGTPEFRAEISLGALSPDGRLVAVFDNTADVRLWEIATGKEIAKTGGRPGRVLRVRFAPDCKTFAVGYADSTILVWEIAALRKQ
jgi:WD40 repeat protein